MSENSTLANYLLDLGYLLLESARAAKANADMSGHPFERGRQFGLYEAVARRAAG